MGNIKPNRARGESNSYLCKFQARKSAYSVSAYHTHIGRVTIYVFLSKSTQMWRFANISIYIYTYHTQRLIATQQKAYKMAYKMAYKKNTKYKLPVLSLSIGI